MQHESRINLAGSIAFFAEFLEESGLFERWVQSCPLFYTSPNAPAVQDILGTWLFSILDGQWRYAHISGLRGDSVSPQILGMKRILSDESLRRALMHLAPCPEQARTDDERARREAQLARSEQWMNQDERFCSIPDYDGPRLEAPVFPEKMKASK